LQETIDSLAAGVVVYDRNERLVMFNAAAMASTPVLKRPGIIGISYEQLARDAGGGTISVAASAVERGGRPLVRIAVEDSGPGIAPDVLSRLFVTFVTTKARGKGTGLGLRICRRIVEEMDGEISARNRVEGGACFEILLPAAEPAEAP
jgi:nitrogen fixation/metabolism regulation signal transduction histidine kinase